MSTEVPKDLKKASLQLLNVSIGKVMIDSIINTFIVYA